MQDSSYILLNLVRVFLVVGFHKEITVQTATNTPLALVFGIRSSDVLESQIPETLTCDGWGCGSTGRRRTSFHGNLEM